MKKRTQVVNSLIILLLVLSTAGRVATPAAAQSTQANSVSVLFILDDSGSMLGNDPANLRYSAAKLFISALDDGDEVAAIRFSTTSQPIIANMTPISNPANQVQLINLLEPVPADGYTDVKAAFELAGTTLQTSTNPGSRKFVIFLTDGQPEVPNKTATYEQEALEMAKRLQVPVYAIALTNASQTSFLTQVASQTDGQIQTAHTANDLLDSYLEILQSLKDRSVMGSGAAGSPAQVTLTLDPALMPYVSKVTFIVSKELGVNARLFDPSDQEILPENPQVSFAITSDPGFAAFSIVSPASGDWRFQITGSGSAQVRAILHSRLRTKIISPAGRLQAGQPMRIVVNLIEEQADGSSIKIVGEASFSALVTLPDGSRQSLDTFYDDGSHGDQTAGDGNFSREFVETSQPGSYSIAVAGLKGVIPVAASTRVDAIGFPQIVIDQPLNQQYEVRSDALPLSMHLEGLAEGAVFEGGFTAGITSPSGQLARVDLMADGAAFTGAFLPAESGVYTVIFQPVNAFYQGLPYQQEAVITFEDVIIAQITGVSTQLGLDESKYQTRFEVQEAIQGIPLVVTVKSTSTLEQPVQLNLEGLPGFSLQETLPVSIPAGAQTSTTLHLLGDAQLQPGIYTGELVISGSGAIDLVNNRLPLQVELFIPTITFSDVEVQSTCKEDRCWQWSTVRLILNSQSTSLHAEWLNIHLDGVDGASLSAESIEVQPGKGQIELEIRPATSFKPGQYEGQIGLEARRAGVQVLPVEPLAAKFQVDGVFKSCTKPLIIFGSILLILAIIIAVVIKKWIENNQQPFVSGTITFEPIKPEPIYNELGELMGEMLPAPIGPSSPKEGINLSGKNKTEIAVGSGKDCDVQIPDDSVQPVHFRITAVKNGKRVGMYLDPVGEVYKVNRKTNGREKVSTKCELKHQDTFIIGNIQVRYLGHGFN